MKEDVLIYELIVATIISICAGISTIIISKKNEILIHDFYVVSLSTLLVILFHSIYRKMTSVSSVMLDITILISIILIIILGYLIRNEKVEINKNIKIK
jgi:predicted aspartyl protease